MKPLIICLALALATLATDGDGMSEQEVLIDFRGDDGADWYVINDGVMGGVSRGEITRTERGTGLFAGELSLENNGGFASVRAAVGRRDLSAHDGLEWRVRGDGRTYQLRLRTDDRFDGVAFRAEFDTPVGEWVTVRLPFARFEPTFRGRILGDVPPLDASRIAQVGFLLADKQPGGFALEIEYVRTWDDPAVEP